MQERDMVLREFLEILDKLNEKTQHQEEVKIILKNGRRLKLVVTSEPMNLTLVKKPDEKTQYGPVAKQETGSGQTPLPSPLGETTSITPLRRLAGEAIISILESLSPLTLSQERGIFCGSQRMGLYSITVIMEITHLEYLQVSNYQMVVI